MISRSTPGLLVAALCLMALPIAAQEVFDREGYIFERSSPSPPAAVNVSPSGGCVRGSVDDPTVELRQSVVDGRVLDPCGYFAGSVVLSSSGNTPASSTPLATIDRMTTRRRSSNYAVGGELVLIGSAETYFLSDGRQWNSGAGSYHSYGVRLDHVEIVGSTVRYVFLPPTTGLIYQQTDYNSGDHSAQGTLGVAGALVLEAEIGTSVAVLRGAATVESNAPTWYSVPRFNYYSTMVGSTVPFELEVTLSSATWTAETFDNPFGYSTTGWVDFANPLSTPTPVELSIVGPTRVPDEATAHFAARLRYENGILRDVTDEATWLVEPAEWASIAGGNLTVAAIAETELALTVGATIVDGAISLSAEKHVLAVRDMQAEAPNAWPMYQADARHSGYVADRLDPGQFMLRWQRTMGGGRELNPVAAGDGKIFVSHVRYFEEGDSLFALDAAGGTTLWSADFGSVFSVNPPSYAYGNVYIQTGNHGSDTWLRAFDGNTGDVVFKSPHLAQWERYLAPTIHDYKVFVNGGTYGGMYSFGALAGEQLWFVDLPQYDQWTPAVANGRAYAHVGEYQPGLYSVDALTGEAAQRIDDANFDWNGWSMQVAPAIAENGDVISVHNGRLITFDPAQQAIRWQQLAQFVGQPSVALGRIYVVNGDRLVVIDLLTQAEVWSWRPDAGAPRAAVVVTDSHVLVSTGSHVHALDAEGMGSVWSYPAAGHLALANDTLYVAGEDGTLTAIGIRNMVVFSDGYE